MVSLLADENFNQRILRGLRLRNSDLDLIVAQRAGLCGASDPDLLGWAAERGRIVLTHDRQTMPRFAQVRIRAGEPMPGLIIVSDTMPVGEAIDVLFVCIECGTPQDFENLVFFLP